MARGAEEVLRPHPAVMRVLFVALIVLAGAAACSDSGSTGKPDDKSKRPVGMSEDIWKAYSGAESGLGADVKDNKKKSPDTEKK